VWNQDGDHIYFIFHFIFHIFPTVHSLLLGLYIINKSLISLLGLLFPNNYVSFWLVIIHSTEHNSFFVKPARLGMILITMILLFVTRKIPEFSKTKTGIYYGYDPKFMVSKFPKCSINLISYGFSRKLISKLFFRPHI
jgi:hypothetical protein